MVASGEWIAADWIAVYWGPTHMRAWAVGPEGRVLAEVESEAGTLSLTPDRFEPALLDCVLDWLDLTRVTDVFVCGMAGARQGWAETPYVTVPAPPRGGLPLVEPAVADDGISVHILPGMRQDDPPDVMRGEETLMAGLIAREPDFDGVVCLPGTHTKWVHISAGEVVSFATFMTGEVFGLLSTSSVLHYTMDEGGWSEPDFDAAVEESLSFPEQVARKLFGIRAEALLRGLSAAASRARLSGLLVGLEIAASKPYWLGRDIVLVGESPLAGAYARALGLSGLTPRRDDPTDLVIAGLDAARKDLIAARGRGEAG
ncbi:2-dehydro-3-deoxygalactonokinase [Amaricoccus solimangrovi]|uniref:2-dehydro-3-deoxygalactonokinase n=1 Tax=Amaricoccus solimangrovi TaxID=2589815 RepID=A0A501WRC9_9RHOB|nr:2-dehydro-3-deoxygalactonokinase [Amaricoccus solimangrovi]TPE51372.1 2-dehydro-3-deoxygalactonokinase [Amaricoccus solimangrovi]